MMKVMQLVEPPPVRAAAQIGAAMMDPMVEEGKMVVSGIKSEDKKRGHPCRTDEAEQLPDRDGSDRDNEERCGHQQHGLRVVMPMTAPRERRRAVQQPPMHGIFKEAKGQETQEHDGDRHARMADELADAYAEEDERHRQIDDQRKVVIGRAEKRPIHSVPQAKTAVARFDARVFMDVIPREAAVSRPAHATQEFVRI